MTPHELAQELLARVRSQVDGLGGLLTESITATLDELTETLTLMDKESDRQAGINLDLMRELDQVCPECRENFDSVEVRALAGVEA